MKVVSDLSNWSFIIARTQIITAAFVKKNVFILDCVLLLMKLHGDLVNNDSAIKMK